MEAARYYRLRLSTGSDLSFRIAGSPSAPPVLLIHGFPSSSRMFRHVLAHLPGAYMIAPDLPGFGDSDVLRAPSFSAFAQAVTELLAHLSIGPRYIYLHDFGAPVGLEIAMRAPEQVLGLIVQNANAHDTGQGEAWAATHAFWKDPTPANAAQATAHLTYEGTRDQYIQGVPPDVAARIPASRWEDDWRVMQRPGRMDTQRALIADYGRYSATFPAIATYLATHRPPALLMWGRHDPFFELRETLSWLEALPRMEAHILDAGHFLLETHAAEATSLMRRFLVRTGAG